MTRQLLAIVLWVGLYGVAECGLTLETSPDSVLVSETMLVTNSLIDAADLTGFQLNFRIMPDGGATGSVGFDSATKPTTDYILGTLGVGFNQSISTTTTTGDSLQVFDDTGSLSNVISVAGGENFAALTFTSSVDASGTFGLYAIDQLGARTHWLNQSGDATQFTNLDRAPVGSMTQVRIGTITIPEPSAFLGILIPALALGIWNARGALFRRRRHNRNLS